MKLKSTFSDYYDWFFHSLTSDECGTYFRNPNLGKKKSPPKGECLYQSIEYPQEIYSTQDKVCELIFNRSYSRSLEHVDRNGVGFIVHLGFVIVGEIVSKMYSLTSITLDNNKEKVSETDYFYNIEELKEGLLKHNYELSKARWNYFGISNDILEYESFDLSPVVKLLRKTFDQPIIIFSHNKLNIDTSLADVKFQKVMQPEQVYQEIALWEHKKLAEKPLVEFDDKNKIKAHGFDLKQSFRHR